MGGTLLSLRACGARPSADVGQRETALGEMIGKSAKRPFVGGTRSARPHGKTGRMPRHAMTTEGRARGPVAYRGWRVGKTRAFPCGRAEPAPPRLGPR